jgi:Raf kinase inhibitor-like YbhB/YbcL family protein
MRHVVHASFGPLLLAACATTGKLPASPPGVVPESITVTSRSFSSGAAIPIDFTCDGSNTTPDVTWSSPPEGTKSLVITLDDLEPLGGNGARWVVVDVKPEARSIRAGEDVAAVGGRLGLNDVGEAGYHGPCPPRREGHHYALRVLALDRALGLPEAAVRDRVNAAMEGHVLGSGELVGTVSR